MRGNLRTARIFALLCVAQLVLALPGLRWPDYLDTPVGLVLIMPFFAAYIAHAAGVPGMLEHGGACGWGWCAPTRAGWAVILATWFLAYWAIASVIGRACRRTADDEASG
jgi:hypothetical protein